jgi:predicted acyltransferase
MKKRYVSLDVLRGLTVAFMCIVNNPGSWSHIFPPLQHAAWVGCTPTDLVFPFFLFCVGCAMAFSLRKFEGQDGKAYKHVIKRGILIFLVGLGLNLFPFFPTSLHDPSWSFGQNYLYWLQHKRIFGVLQGIGMAYILGGCLVVWLKKPGRLLGAIGVLCAAYTAILLIFGRDPGAFTLEGNVSLRIDEWLVGGNHCYHGYNGTNFDPEGLLGTMTRACTVLIGYLIGYMLVHAHKQAQGSEASGLQALSESQSVVNRMFFYGCCSLGLAMIISIWIPISKPLWSASYVFYAGGWAMLALGCFAWLIDIRGYEKAFVPFKAMGMNPLTAFVLSGLLAKTFSICGFYPSKYFGANEYTSLAYALIFAFVIFCVQWVLYKKNIVIKL